MKRGCVHVYLYRYILYCTVLSKLSKIPATFSGA
jgi:hypothetical protein